MRTVLFAVGVTPWAFFLHMGGVVDEHALAAAVITEAFALFLWFVSSLAART